MVNWPLPINPTSSCVAVPGNNSLFNPFALKHEARLGACAHPIISLWDRVGVGPTALRFVLCFMFVLRKRTRNHESIDTHVSSICCGSHPLCADAENSLTIPPDNRKALLTVFLQKEVQMLVNRRHRNAPDLHLQKRDPLRMNRARTGRDRHVVTSNQAKGE